MARVYNDPGMRRAIAACNETTRDNQGYTLSGLGIDTLPDGLIRRRSKYFWCTNNRLTSLYGCPNHVTNDFTCGYNNLPNLKGAPRWVGGNFNCTGNPLMSLEGAPDHIGGLFWHEYFTDADYRLFIQRKHILQDSNDEAGIGSVIGLL